MSGLRPPGPLSLEGNLTKNYADWIREFYVYEIATQLTDKPEKVRCATFLHVAGPQAQTIHQTLTFTRDEVNKDWATKTEIQRVLWAKTEYHRDPVSLQYEKSTQRRAVHKMC